ncbi:SF1B family DNA helicase RecD2 [Texcoconibacillus texcoconensis]|uniref:ATP-dependent RecD2 DNA helicase n=1 Tax=Texcoconibacillus texcoconensis TaxID=1095777 RepID=A0A840QP67_9BACI|nr:ATP-dependent RecD-like DNA helicase [Texcoconibacillus texcoconensis]MBB5173182.1 exodeoxyribonuclease V alpha subunit [Texcoconibacillus texcoconensis]
MIEETSSEQPYVKGEITRIIYHRDETMYTVARVRILEASVEEEADETIVVGTMPAMEQEETYLFYGQWKDHPKFGRQFQVDHFRKIMPQTKQGIILYLSSDRFKGIGQKTAEQIVDTLGEHAISKILESRDVLHDVPNMNEKKVDMIYETLIEEQGVEQVLIALYEYGFGMNLAVKVYQTYKHDAMRIIQEYPYRMIEEVEGVGFAKADAIGHHIGMTGDHPDRLKAAIYYIVSEESLRNGHVYVRTEDVIIGVQNLLAERDEAVIPEETIAEQIIEIGEETRLVVGSERMYLPSLYYAERGIASHIERLQKDDEQTTTEYPDSEFLKAIGDVEERFEITYAPSQRDAVRAALESPLTLLTGGPGTGKTTVIRGVVESYAMLEDISLDEEEYDQDDPFPVLLVAPTGRAAKRMNEATGLPASTIHRLLGYKGSQDGFEKDEYEPLEGKLLIVDEMSMVDVWLANQLFKAVPDGMKVLLVGDEDQLPSVGPGQVLFDLLESHKVPVQHLSEIYRQAGGSAIIEFSHGLKSGELHRSLTKESNDLRFFSCEQQQVIDVVEQVCKRAADKGYRAKDIQVLAPMYRGNAGIERLNERLQALFNPQKESRREIPFGDVVYRVGDVVLQLVNNPEEHVYNGDRGEIVALFRKEETTESEDMLVISFDGIEVQYKKSDLSQITHAYCCSIHKSQGSEFPIVVMPVVKSYYRMLKRNLIYTGVTRAKSFLILCGEWNALELAVAKIDESKRQTTLKERLQGDTLEIEPEDETMDVSED